MVTPHPLLFRKAQKEDAQIIAHLVNSAYRGDSSRLGWTTEADLLDGLRTSEREISGLIESAQSLFLLCIQGAEVIGSVHLKKMETAGYLGMFVVKPELQGRGIGRQFMQTAESTAQREWGVRKMTMQVITLRHELIAFYERRGYRRTGKLKPFPPMANARVQGLQFEVLEKDLEPLTSAAKDPVGNRFHVGGAAPTKRDEECQV